MARIQADESKNSFNMLEEGASTMVQEEASQRAARQQDFINKLQAALVRIENKTYGVCRITGKLIPKERLLAVPHATLSIEGKEIESKNKKKS
jgi:RNA polymerase-binding transcription factor DksA